LETLRALATVLVVLLHAAVPFAITPMPGLAWPVRHPEGSAVVEAIFWGIGCGIMPVFFWLSGYGAAQSLASRGMQQFWHWRWKRIAVPLLVFAAVLLPCELYIWMIGWALDGQIPWVKLRSLKLGPYHENLWGLSHLWYLEYLWLNCALLVARDWLAEWSAKRREAYGVHPLGEMDSARPPDVIEQRLFALWRRPGRVAFVAAAVALVLWWSPETLVGFQHSFFPVPAKFALSAVFFASGVLTFRCGRIDVTRGWGSLLAVPMLLALVFPLLRMEALGEVHGLDRVWLAVGLGGYATLMASGLWDCCARQQGPAGPVVVFISSASFWTYLVHHPLVAICQIALRPTGWPALIQFTLTAAATLAVCWVSYQWLVKPTVIGVLLNGGSSARDTPADSEPLPRAA
jgi:peptidoglycan/LPS O-acetylase OafA/YrhL